MPVTDLLVELEAKVIRALVLRGGLQINSAGGALAELAGQCSHKVTQIGHTHVVHVTDVNVVKLRT